MKNTSSKILARFPNILPRNGVRYYSSNFQFAVTREIDDNIVEQALCHNPALRQSINLKLAKQQHNQLINAIKECGVPNIYTLPSYGHPDSVFIEDTAIVVDKTVLITRPGAKERRGETEAVKRLFQQSFGDIQIKEVTQGTIDGGDVLFTGKEFIVGETKRTNKRGILSLQLAFPHIPVYFVNVDSLSWNANQEHTPLHLKSFSSLLAPHHIIVGDSIGEQFMKWIQKNRSIEKDTVLSFMDQFPDLLASSNLTKEHFQHLFHTKRKIDYHFVLVPDQDAANCVYINQTIIRRASKEFPESGKVFEKVHIRQIEIHASELAKVDGAITCCSLIF